MSIAYEPVYDKEVPVPCFFTDQIYLSYKSYISRFDKGKERLVNRTVRQCYYCRNLFANNNEEMPKHLKVCSAWEGITYTFDRVTNRFMCWKLRRIEEIWGRITNIFQEICQNLAQNLRRIEETSYMYVLVDLTFTDAMSSNITVYIRKNTKLTVGKKWTFNMKLCNLFIILWTHMIWTWTNTLPN